MRAPEHALPAERPGGEPPEGRVNLWADTVGEAAAQLGVLLVLAFAAHLANSLLSRP